MAAGVIARSDRILRAARMTRLAERAVARGNYDRCRRLAECARQLLAAVKNLEPTIAACAAPSRAGSTGNGALE